MLAAIEAAGLTQEGPALLARLREWDGSYEAGAAGPVAFETLLHRVVHAFPDTGTPSPGADWNQIVTYLLSDLAALPAAARTALLRDALRAAAADAARFPTWGDMHVMRVQSAIGLVPAIGKRFRMAEYPVSGSRETVMKTFHGVVNERHRAGYGSQARFIADMSDPDANWFVLFAGQDGWLGSANFADQIPLWREGGYVQLPLTQAAVEREFPHVQRLEPGG